MGQAPFREIALSQILPAMTKKSEQHFTYLRGHRVCPLAQSRHTPLTHTPTTRPFQKGNFRTMKNNNKSQQKQKPLFSEEGGSGTHYRQVIKAAFKTTTINRNKEKRHELHALSPSPLQLK
jgi:hypothetical protein